MEFIQQNIYLVVIAVLSGAMLLATSLRRPGGASTLSPMQATLLINRENAQLIDVREPADYLAGHLPESRNIPAARLDERIGEIEKLKGSPLILVCQSGTRSISACAKLGKLGFAKLHSLDGGVEAWLRAGLPINRGGKK